jgi:uncharacterized protein YxjI
MAINYPLKATFKIVTLSPEVQVQDALGNVLMQVKQKLFTLKEDTTIFADQQKTIPLYKMKADRVIGFGAVHHITRLSDNTKIGAVKADGLRSIWRSRYTVTDANDKTVFSIREQNPWIKVLDAVLGEIDLIGPFISMFINPKYLLEDEKGVLRYVIAKKRSFFERNFTLEQVSKEEDDQYDERLIALALIQTIFLEHRRG